MHTNLIFRSSLCFLTVGLLPSVVAGQTAPEPPPPTTAVEAAASVSPEFRSKIQSAMDSIPAPVLRRIRQSGWQVKAAPFVVDAAPQLSGVHPRGWPAGTTWNNVDALHLPQQKWLVFGEKRVTVSGRTVRTTRLPGVLRHELAHAYDIAGGQGQPLSSGQEFGTAYRRDINQQSAAQRTQLRYYLQPGRAGKQETFAEAFAIALGGGSDRENEDLFRQAFPNVMARIEELLEVGARG